jgi:hypothetical protein
VQKMLELTADEERYAKQRKTRRTESVEVYIIGYTLCVWLRNVQPSMSVAINIIYH